MNLRLFRLLYMNWYYGVSPSPPYMHVVQIGDPVLRQLAQPVDPAKIRSDPMIKLYKMLRYVMRESKAAGLAAPQLGVSLRLFAIHIPTKKEFNNPVVYEKRGMEPIPFQIWINPVMKVLDYDKVYGEECCESMRGFSADIPRYKKVLISGLDESGTKKEWTASGWSARLLQHEMDHLDGNFFTDIMVPKSLECTNWNIINRHGGRIYTTYIPKR